MSQLRKAIKVIAYITRQRGNKQELLVFTHRDYPEAGLQVPGGTVKAGEKIEDALHREISEETGLSNVKVKKKIAVYDYYNPYTNLLNERHVFHLAANEETAERWEWIETGGGEVSERDGYVFCFRWADLAEEIHLAGNRGDYLHSI